ncbi:MAG: serine/threonine-protein kinase [Phycisphaerales bacterium]
MANHGSNSSNGTPPDVAPRGSAGSDESLLIAGALAQARRGSDAADPPERLPPPTTFPGYELIREIHRGGQGVVYLALQKTTKRKVAVKVLHQGPFAGEKDRQRFEREVEILAQLNHPNIVAVIDSGITPTVAAPGQPAAGGDASGGDDSAGAHLDSATPIADARLARERSRQQAKEATRYQGSFYCVMEYISGSPLDVWVKEKQPGIDQVLHVFVRICDAVNAAHLKGIIHRDLKPANIRVDHDGHPHVLDFGLARVGVGATTGGDTPELMTVTGQFIGSLPWASPEQAEGAPEKLDVRTDVYSMGVMLYQMLTDRFPYQVVGMMRDILDNILRAEPARPSTVRRQINNEVETIVLKCLSKERERRYQNAGELGRDLTRYLAGEPIEAKRDSGWYIITKTARRHKVAVGVASAFLVLIVGFGLGMGGLYQRAEAKRVEAEEATGRAEAAAREVEAALELSETQRATAEAIRSFWEDMLSSVDPDRPVSLADTLGPTGRDVRVADVLRASADAREIEARFGQQPEVEAAVKHLAGATYVGLGLPSEAEPLLRSAFDIRTRLLGAEADETLLTHAFLAMAVAQQRRYEDARALFVSLIDATERAAGEGDARPYRAMASYAVFLRNTGRGREALQMMAQAAEGFRGVPGAEADLGRALLMRAEMTLGYGSPQAAEVAGPIAEEGAALLGASVGPDHPNTAMMNLILARVRFFQGDVPEAERLFAAGLAVLEAQLPPTHPDRLKGEAWWAEHLHRTDRLREAEAVYRSLVQRWTESSGGESLDTAWARAMLGSNLNRQQRWGEAEGELFFALGIYRRDVGDAHERTRLIAAKIAQMFRESGQTDRLRELPSSLR